MPMRLQTEPPMQEYVEDDQRMFAFCMYLTVIVGLSVIALVLHYHFVKQHL